MRTKRVLKRFLAALMAATLALPVMTHVKANETYEPGATVVSDDNSPSGYTVHFVYEPEDTNVAGVSLTGTFNYVTKDNQTGVTPYEYENGMYPSNMNPTTGEYGYTEEMTFNEETGYYELSFPITSGTFLYSYIVSYTDGTSVTIEDPANPAPSKVNPNSLTETGDIDHSLVYGKYDAEKQSESVNMDYVLPANGNKGQVEYVTYTNINSETDYLGIYTPANYNPDRIEPYKVIYLSHGSGGNETDWYAVGHADNIMDNLVNQGLTEGAVIVTMNNQNLGWDIPRMEENIIDYVIPFTEENYNVSTRVSDKAMVGLSGGGNLTINMYYDHPDLFGYFADFSGSPRQRDPNTDAESLEKYKLPTVMAVVGTIDFASNPGSHASVEQFASDCRRINPDHFVTTDAELYVNGSHDWFTWTQSFYKFLKDVAWINTEPTSINAVGTQKVYIDAEDWGPVVTKTIIHLDHEISQDSIDSNDFTVVESKQALSPDWTETVATKTRTILNVYASDETGNKVNENSNYIAIEMYVSPTVDGEGAAFFYSPETWYNQWCEVYELFISLDGELVTSEGEVVSTVTVESSIDLSSDEDRICPVLELFTKGQFTAADGNVLPYTYYQPAQDEKKNALVIWLHGAGEGGTNPEIPVLGNKVTALVSEEFQNEFDGAYVLVPQCPEGYGWPVDADGEYTSGATPSRWRESLFELIDTYVKANPDIDTDRIIIGGCSNGGNMVYDILLSHMGYFAAAFPMCHEFDIETATEEQLAYLKEFPVWSTYTLEDSSSFIGSIPIVEKMKEIEATNFHYSEFADASETTGRYFGDPEDLYSLDTTGTSTTPLKYDGHWAWTKFFNNACEEDGLNAWHWLGQQKKVSNSDDIPNVPDTPNTPSTPSNSINTGDHLNVMPIVAVGTIALLGASFFAYKKKKEMTE